MKFFSRDPYDDEPGGLKRRLANLPPGVRWGALAAALIAVIFIAWLGVEGLSAKSNLEQARTSAEQSKDALLSGKSEDATRFAENAQFHARQARAATHSVPWGIAAAVPLLGSPLKTTQQISDVVVGLADNVLLPGATMGAGLSPDKLIDGTRIDLKLLREEEPRLSELSAAAGKLDAEAQAISSPGYVQQISDARSQLQHQTSNLAQLLRNTSLAAQLAPSMLGGDGPRNYLMAFQTSSEARGTGGLAGAFAVLRVENGTPALDTLATNLELQKATAKISLGPEFDKVYGYTNPYGDFRNSNLSPHFPYAARIWKSMWEEQSGMAVDGVIALDPVALSYILGALGPVTMPDGEVITQENVVELTQATVYVRFPLAEDQAARKEYLQSIAREIAIKATGKVPSPRKLLDALGRAVNERRIAVWSSSPRDQQILEETPLAHTLLDDGAPYAQVVINNIGGTKMDYFLKREIEYEADGCDGDMRNSTITVRLANTGTETSLPTFYADTVTWPRQTAGGPVLNHQFKIQVPNGTMIFSVRVIATKGAKLMSVTANGERTSAMIHTERGRPSFEVQVVIPPGQSGELSFRLSEPSAPGDPRVPVQPLIDEVVPVVAVPAC